MNNNVIKYDDLPEEAKEIASKISLRIHELHDIHKQHDVHELFDVHELLDKDKVLNELMIELYEVLYGEKRDYQ